MLDHEPFFPALRMNREGSVHEAEGGWRVGDVDKATGDPKLGRSEREHEQDRLGNDHRRGLERLHPCPSVRRPCSQPETSPDKRCVAVSDDLAHVFSGKAARHTMDNRGPHVRIGERSKTLGRKQRHTVAA